MEEPRPDIDLYTTHAEEYDRLQQLRDDYRLAIEASLKAATTHAPTHPATIVDFCGGTGLHLHKLDARINIRRGRVIDINREFLEIAACRRFRNCTLETQCQDIVQADIEDGAFDLVFATFAYHHVPDHEKVIFLEKACRALHDLGRLVVTEIYLPDRDTTLRYYQKVLDEIPGGHANEPLRTFLTQTAESTEFEYKVAKSFADAQFSEAGLRVLDEQKIWPQDDTFSSDIGTFVTVLAQR